MNALAEKRVVEVPSWSGVLQIDLFKDSMPSDVSDDSIATQLFKDEIKAVLDGKRLSSDHPHRQRIIELAKKVNHVKLGGTQGQHVTHESIAIHVQESKQLLSKKEKINKHGRKFTVYNLEGFLYASFFLWNIAYRVKNPFFYQVLANIEKEIKHHHEIIGGISKGLQPHISRVKSDFGGMYNQYIAKSPRKMAFHPVSPHGRLAVELVRDFDSMLRDLFRLLMMNEITQDQYDTFALQGRNHIGAMFTHYCHKAFYLNRPKIIKLTVGDYTSTNADIAAVVVAAREKIGDVSDEILTGVLQPLGVRSIIRYPAKNQSSQ